MSWEVGRAGVCPTVTESQEVFAESTIVVVVAGPLSAAELRTIFELVEGVPFHRRLACR